MARTFDGASGVVHWSVGALTGQTSAGTYAAIVRRTNDANFHTICTLHTSGGAACAYFQINPTDQIVLGGTVGEATSTTTVLTATGWVLVAATKASGVVTPRFHKLVYSTGTWTHEVGSGSFGDGTGPGAGGTARTSWQGADLWQGDIAAIGVWSSALSDAQVENLAHSLTHWWSISPAAMWVLDQSATTQSIPDLTGGGANQASLTDTTISTSSVPLFSYGAPVVSVTRTGGVAATSSPPPPRLRRQTRALLVR